MTKLINGLLLSTLALGFATAAHAEVTIDEGTKQISSDATIKVNPGAEVPTTPEDKNEPDGTTNQKGPLSIDNVIVFAFDEMNLSGLTQKIPLVNKAPQNVQVTDTRGTGAGWNLQVKQTPLVDEAGTKELRGAYISLALGGVVPGKDNVSSDLMPEAIDYSATAVDKGVFQKIMTAEENNGLGTWLMYFNKDSSDDIQLVVPSGNMVGDYAGTVLWALSDTPTANPA